MTILPSNNLPNSEPYCYNELELLNLAILMCLESNASGVDNILFKHKYKIISIDRSVDTAVGTIKYDVCLTSIEKEITLGIEIKGENASNLDEKQLNRYKNIPLDQFIYSNGIPSTNTNIHKIETLLMVNTPRITPVRQKLEQLGYNFSILGLDSDYLSASLDEIESIDLEFSDDLKTNPNILTQMKPPLLIKLDKESSEIDIASDVLSEIFKILIGKQDSFKVDEILENTYCSIPHLLNIVGTDIKSAVQNKIKRCLRDLSKNELEKNLIWESSEKKWILKNLTYSSPIKLGNKLNNVHNDFVARKTGSTTSVSVDQLTLFDYDDY